MYLFIIKLGEGHVSLLNLDTLSGDWYLAKSVATISSYVPIVSFENKIKRKEYSWQLTTKCSTNHANLLVIVSSHESLAITTPWLQEAIQSMTHKMFPHIQNMHQEQANIHLRSSKPLEASMK